MLAVLPTVASAQAVAKPGTALSRASVQVMGSNVRVGKKMRGSSSALVGLPLILVIAAGAAATAVAVNEVAGDDGPNSP